MKNHTLIHRLDNTVKKIDAFIGISNNLVHGCLKEKILFMHIQKCGGTSIAHAIRSCYRTISISDDRHFHRFNSPAATIAANKITSHVNQCDFPLTTTGEDAQLSKYRENLLLYYMCQENISYIAGPFGFSNIVYQNFSNQYAFITVLRDPVKRWISGYFFNKYNNKDTNFDIEITEYIGSEQALKKGSIYVERIGGINKEEDYRSEQAIARAKENLHKFRIVGCLEYQEDFIRQFEEQFRRRLKIRRLNKSPKSKSYQNTIITKEIEEKIREICKPDIEIYEHVVKNFVGVN